MDWYAGRHTKRIDAKGRVSVPAPLRAVLARDGYDSQFFAYRALHQPAIEAGGGRLMQDIDTALANVSPFSVDYAEISCRLSGSGELVSLDPEGRFSLPPLMQDLDGGTGEVVSVGMMRKFQIWSPQRFAEFAAKAETAALAHFGGGGVQR